MLYLTVLCFCFAAVSAKSAKIINGEDAEVGDCPHQVALYRSNSFTCGGSVIADGWIVTAAHCVEGVSASVLSVQIGATNRQTSGITFSVSQIYIHENYNQGSGAYPNDIALLRFTTSADMTDYVIAVAPSNSPSFAGSTCLICGWGYTEAGTQVTNNLQKAKVTALSYAQAVSAWGSTNIVDALHLCVQGSETPNGEGSCNGDSGGPLECNGVLAGVTSWGRSGCHVDGTVTHPSAYVRLSTFYDWIASTCNCI